MTGNGRAICTKEALAKGYTTRQAHGIQLTGHHRTTNQCHTNNIIADFAYYFPLVISPLLAIALTLLPLNIQIRTQPTTLLRNPQISTLLACQRRQSHARINIEQRIATAGAPYRQRNVILLLKPRLRRARQR